jgi:cytidine deaminase
MSSTDPLPSTDQRPELVFALVGGAGTCLKDLSDTLKSELTMFGYHAMDIRLSDLLVYFTGFTKVTGTSEFERITHLQAMGNAFRRCLNRGDALALAGIKKIRAERAKLSILKNPDDPAPACAYILHQLKHPAEVDLLRQVYGASFLLIAGHARHTERVKELARRMAQKEALRQGDHESKASEVIRIDEKQDDDKFGQNTRDTYPKADFFSNLESPSWKDDVRRFVELLFSHPSHTPKPEEYAMYQANAASLRSSDDNRQVGAVIARLNLNRAKNIRDANIIAVGMNEVPRGGYGGYYCDLDSPDCRDQKLRGDRAFDIKISILTELIKKIVQKEWLQEVIKTQDAYILASDLLKDLKGTQFLDIGEFSRPVHAEMAALIDAARRGVAVDGHSMYVTTFPCHNCVKHIIAAGIQRVVYLEPYPKSRALDLYHEDITVESLYGNAEEGKVVFFPFTGVAPRQYRQLFSMSERGAKKGNSLIEWNNNRRSLAPPYVPQNASLLYLATERQELKSLSPDIYSFA